MRPIKILVVEDNEADTFYLQKVLDRMGVVYSIEVLGDGESALHFLLNSEVHHLNVAKWFKNVFQERA